MDIFEIRDKDIDVEEIMQKIRENMKKRAEFGISPEEKIEKINMNLEYGFDQDNSDIPDFIKKQPELEYLNLNWIIQNDDYIIQSHRSFTGRFLKKGRELVHGEVRRYVDPVFWKQSEFNLKNAKLSNIIFKKIAEFADLISAVQTKISSDVDEKISASQTKILSDIRDELSLIQAENLKEINNRINILLNTEHSSRIKYNTKSHALTADSGMINKARISGIIDNNGYSTMIVQKPKDHFDFSEGMENFGPKYSGGSFEADIFLDSIRYFKDCRNVVCIGFEFSYFLELIGKHYPRRDETEDIVADCKKMNIIAIKNDALSHMQSIGNESIDGILISQIPENMPVEDLFNLLKLTYEKLLYNSYILIYIPNMLSTLVYWNPFNPDPMHKSFIPPDILKFLLKICGFKDINEKYYNLVSEDIRLKPTKIQDPLQEELIADLIKDYNSNMTRLNDILFGFRDCVVMAKK